MTAPRETFDLAKCLLHLKCAYNYADSLTKEKSITGGIKERIKMIKMRCSAAQNEVLWCVPPAYKQVLTDQLLNDESATQFEGIIHMLLDLPQHARDTIERYVESVYKITQAKQTP